ncbi:hypothetical protein ILUMI_13779, partial [Ignelater luminosus]
MEPTRIQISLLENKATGPHGNISLKPPGLTAIVQEKAAYNKNLDGFNKIDASVLLVLTTNMTEEILKLVMRFQSSSEVSYKREDGDNTTSVTSKLKSLWRDPKMKLGTVKSKKLSLNQASAKYGICKGTLSHKLREKHNNTKPGRPNVLDNTRLIGSFQSP